MRVIASFVGGWGHAAPLVPLATWAAQLGHRVSFAGQAALSWRLAEIGFDVDVVGPDTLAATSRPLAPIDRHAEQVVMSEHFVDGFGRTRATLLGRLFDRELVELVICDEVDVGAMIAAEQRAIPCVSVNVIAAGLLTSPTVVGPAWDALRREHGLASDPEARRFGGDVVIAPLPKSLRHPDAPPPSHMRFIRPPILDDSPAGLLRAEGRSLVYVTLGTVFNLESGDLLPRLVDAMNLLSATVDIDVVITTGPNIRTDDLPPPAPRVRVETMVAQRELLRGCRAVVCHAGSGTLVDALSLGIPVVLLPLGADQPDNADRCEALGTGIVLDAVGATRDDITRATRAVLNDPGYRGAALDLAAEARAQPSLHRQLELQHLLAVRH